MLKKDWSAFADLAKSNPVGAYALNRMNYQNLRQVPRVFRYCFYEYEAGKEESLDRTTIPFSLAVIFSHVHQVVMGENVFDLEEAKRSVVMVDFKKTFGVERRTFTTNSSLVDAQFEITALPVGVYFQDIGDCREIDGARWCVVEIESDSDLVHVVLEGAVDFAR